MPNGKSFIENAAFSPWNALYLHVRCDVYRGLRDAFDAYHLEQVAEWRRRAGLGLYAATSSPDKLQRILDSQRWDAVVGLESAGGSRTPPVAVVPAPVVSGTKSAPQSAASSSVAQKLREKKHLRHDVAAICSSSKGSSSGSRKRGAQN